MSARQASWVYRGKMGVMDTAQPLGFGALLRRYRLAAGLTQEELAERAQVSKRSIGDLERGAPHRPRKDTATLLAEALALSPRDRAAFVEAARRRAAPAPSVAGTGSAVPFVGRTRELALLERHLAGEGPPVLLLAGEPGIGKTRLLHEAIPRAVAQGQRVLTGGCQRRGGQEPYAPLLEALHHDMRSQRPAQLRAQLRGCAWLIRLLPELADGPVEALPRWTLAPEQERRLIFAAVARYLSNVAGPAGTLLVLDDLQWAGADALDLLATLARSAAEVPLRVVGAYRDTEVQPRDHLSVMLADLAHAGLAARRMLGPLAPEEAVQLLDGLLPEAAGERNALRERVLQRTGGVPFFLVSCAQALRLDDVGDHGQEAVSWDVAQSVRQRTADLPEVAQALLGTAAVVGRVAPRGLLVSVAAQPEGEVVAALDVTCRARLLEETENDAYQFAHDVIREVVEADLSAARRTVLHRRIAEALEQLPGEPVVELLAYHYSRSDARDKAVVYLEQAGDRAQVQSAHTAAEGYYRTLVDRLDGLGRAVAAAGAREKLGRVLTALGRYAEAQADLERAVETYGMVGDAEAVGRATAQLAETHQLQGSWQEGVACVQPLIESFEGSVSARTPPRALAALYLALAHLLWVGTRYQECLGVTERASDLARAAGNERVQAQAEARRGVVLFRLGRYDEARRVLEGALPLREAVGDPDCLILVLDPLATMYRDAGDLGRSASYGERALKVTGRLGDPARVGYALQWLGETRFLQGDWEQARLHLERAAEMMRSVESSRLAAYPPLHLGAFHLAAGDWEAASRYLEEAVAVAQRSGHSAVLRMAQPLLAQRDLLVGKPEEACARLAPLLNDGDEEGDFITEILPMLAWAHVELGDLAQAGAVLARAVAHARAENNNLSLVEVWRVQALAAIRQQHWEEAEHTLEEGLALTRPMPYPYAEARLLHVYGDMHIQKGEPGPARERLEAALAIFQRLGARKDIERVEQELSTLRSAPLE